MRILYVAGTVFQLLTVINMHLRMNTSAESADLILTKNDIPNVENIKKHLDELKLFANIYWFEDINIKVRAMRKNANTSILDYYKLIKAANKKPRDLNDFLADGAKIELAVYDEIFCFKISVLKCFNDLPADGPKIFLYDEGVGTYSNEIFEHRKRIDGIYVYQPELADYYEQIPEKVHKIPLLDCNDNELKIILNTIFECSPTQIQSLQNIDILLFDQPFRLPEGVYKHIPTSLEAHININKRYSLNKALCQCFVTCFNDLSKLSPNNCYVKLHPRSKQDKIAFYVSQNIRLLHDLGPIPFELLLMNLKNKHLTLACLSSSAACAGNIYVCNNSKHLDATIYVLASLVEQNFPETHGFFAPSYIFYKKMIATFPNIHMINSYNEIRIR